jgi:hypothetical protein
MGIILMIIAGICFGWWALTTVQDYWRSSMNSLVTQASQSDFLPSAPLTPPISVDPNKMRLAINPPVTIDTRAAQRAAVEGAVRQIDQRIQTELSKVPLPPNILGPPRH